MSEQVTGFNLMRHGESQTNADEAIFSGGAPDTGPMGPIGLTAFGVRQSYAMGHIAHRHNVTITGIYSSTMLRARQTTERVHTAYADSLDQPIALTDIQEISHGSLELDQPAPTKDKALSLREASRLATRAVLLEQNLDARLANAYSPWLYLQGRGDGESNLGAGLRGWRALHAQKLPPDSLVIGHHGTWRSMLGLTECISTENLTKLADAHSTFAAQQSEVRQAITARKATQEEGSELSIEDLKRTLAPIAGSLVTMTLLLAELKAPSFVQFCRKKHLSNGALMQFDIDPYGIWHRRRMIEPVLSRDAGTSGPSSVPARIYEFT